MNERALEAIRLHEAGKTWNEIAPLIGMHHGDSVRKIVREARKKGELEATPALKAKAPETNQERVEAERQQAKVREDIRELKQLTKLRAFQEEVRDTIRETVLTMDVPALLPIAKSAGTWDEETAVLLLGDVHVGQYTVARVNGGWNQTPEVTKAQFKQLAQAIYRIWQIQHQSTPWRTLKIIGLGDQCEGAHLRVSQAKRSTLATHQSRDFGVMLAEFMSYCLQFFERVEYESVPGNHARISQKAGDGGLDELDPGESFDWLGGEIARLILQPAVDAGRAYLLNHETVDAETEIMGHKIYFEHGSSIHGGGGWGGIPFYQHMKMASSYRDLEGDFTLLAIGHFHRHFELPSGFRSTLIGNGSFPPTTPFVFSNKHQATRPSQTLLSIHPKKGITMKRLIYLDIPREKTVANA